MYFGLKKAFLIVHLLEKKMSWRGKRKDEDVRASDDDSPAKKVAKPAESSEESDDIVVCNVSLLHLSIVSTVKTVRFRIRLSFYFVNGGF